MVVVRISETYDLSTKVDKMGLIGVHTPGLETISQLYYGFLMNYKKYRLVGCDITLACASMLPADPLQIGTEAGDIAPQDMFNPILYTAVSNDSFNTLINRIYGLGPVSGSSLVGPQSIVASGDDAFPNALDGVDQFNVYYALLASEGWKKAMPQSGLSMHDLYPIVYEVVDNYGNMNAITAGQSSAINTLLRANVTTDTGEDITGTYLASVFRGDSKRMPALPTHRKQTVGALSDWANPFPTTYVAAIITPPAKLHKLYYRMRVTWAIEFFDPVPSTEFDTLAGLNLSGQRTYASDYAAQSKNMDDTTDMVDVKDADVTKIMTAGK